MKIHVWSVIKYLLLFVFIIFFILVFKQNYLVFLLFPYVLLPVILIPLFLLNVRKVSVNAGAVVGETDCGNDIIFFVEYKNPTYFPFLKCTLSFSVNNLYFNNDKKNRLNFNMLAKKTDRININVATSRVGLAAFEGKELEITGYMGFVSVKLPASFCVQVPVFPVSSGEAVLHEMPYSEGYDEYNEPDLKGSPSSDIKEIREYRPGDRLSRIHWKLSAKMDDLEVKEMERTSVMSVVILPELEKSMIDKTVNNLDILAGQLTAAGERFEICLFNNASCEFDYYTIDGEEALKECYRNMFFLPLYEGGENAKEAYFGSGQKSSLVLYVYGDKSALFEDGLEIS